MDNESHYVINKFDIFIKFYYIYCMIIIRTIYIGCYTPIYNKPCHVKYAMVNVQSNVAGFILPS